MTKVNDNRRDDAYGLDVAGRGRMSFGPPFSR